MSNTLRGIARAPVLLLVGLGVLVALGGLWWSATVREQIKFLPHLKPAEWIVFPVSPESLPHPRLELATVFQSTFSLDKKPDRAVIQIAGFGHYTLVLNDLPVDKPVHRGTNWKQPDEFDVTGLLHAGENRILATVFNSNGPPALWLSLEANGKKLTTDETWQASYAGAAWCNARLASRPMTTTLANRLHFGEPSLSASFRACWPLLLIFTALIFTGYWFVNFLARGTISFAGRNRYKEILPIIGLAGLWVLLFVNNLRDLPRTAGFDVSGHLAYIQYIQDRHALPGANEGWEMFQGPLYYLIATAFLELLSASLANVGGLIIVRLLGMVIGVVHFALVWASVRLLFPGERSKANWALVLAACLPPLLYLSQYVTNEALAAMLVSASVYLTLRLLKGELLSVKSCIRLGICLGAALLTKSTVVLVVPVIFAALFWVWVEKRPAPLADWVERLILILVVCISVSGWHYLRLWRSYGNPLIGVWDPKLGYSWWQDEGYRTGAFYWRFGNALFHPWYSAMNSFADGMYSTLWGDGLLGGGADYFSRPPWNFELMAIGYWLALFPSLMVVAGAVLALVKFIRQPSAEWFLLLGLGFISVWAVIYVSMAVPYYCMVKSFYGLCAMVPFCALGALGVGTLARRGPALRHLSCIAFGLWAMSSYASFWIDKNSTRVTINRSQELIEQKQYAAAVDLLKTRLQSGPQNVDARVLPATILLAVDNPGEAGAWAQQILQNDPGDGREHYVLAVVLNREHEVGRAFEEARRAVELSPEYVPAREFFLTLATKQRRFDQAIQVAREGLGIAPYSPDLHYYLGFGLLATGQDIEAEAQLRLAFLIKPRWAEAHSQLGDLQLLLGRRDQAVAQYNEALRLEPDSPETLNNLAWIRAVSPQAEFRDGAEAVRLAEQACLLTDYQAPLLIGTLAAAYAEVGRFQEATATATRAHELAMAKGETNAVERNAKLIEIFSAKRAYRDTSGNPAATNHSSSVP